MIVIVITTDNYGNDGDERDHDDNSDGDKGGGDDAGDGDH